MIFSTDSTRFVQRTSSKNGQRGRHGSGPGWAQPRVPSDVGRLGGTHGLLRQDPGEFGKMEGFSHGKMDAFSMFFRKMDGEFL